MATNRKTGEPQTVQISPKKKHDPFRFELEGRTYEFPNLKDLPIGHKALLASSMQPVQRARESGVEPSQADLFQFGMAQIEILEKVSPGITYVADETQLAEIMKAWNSHSEIALGE